MKEQIERIIRKKMGENFKEIVKIYENNYNYLIISCSVKDEELPVVIASKLDFSLKFHPMAYFKENKNEFLKGRVLTYSKNFDDEVFNGYSEKVIRIVLKQYGANERTIEAFINDLKKLAKEERKGVI